MQERDESRGGEESSRGDKQNTDTGVGFRVPDPPEEESEREQNSAGREKPVAPACPRGVK